MKVFLLTINSLILLTQVQNAYSTSYYKLTAQDLENIHDTCQQTTPTLQSTDLEQLQRFEFPDNSAVHAYIRCILENMHLWSDKEGLEVKRITKIFSKYRMTTELFVVLEYCNQSHRNISDTNKWAYDAYTCAASGRFGQWVKDYIKSIRGKKLKQ